MKSKRRQRKKGHSKRSTARRDKHALARPRGTAGQAFGALVALEEHLRGPKGCPWDRKQTNQTLRTFLLEETYEVLEALDSGDDRKLAEELGDLLLEVVFLAQIASEQQLFRIHDSLALINEKLERRHPHVFGTATANTAGEVKHRWDEIKAEEKEQKGRAGEGLLSSVPRALPALVEATQLTSRAAGVGFDWQNGIGRAHV